MGQHGATESERVPMLAHHRIDPYTATLRTRARGGVKAVVASVELAELISAATKPMHSRDEDCTLDGDDQCIECGVSHTGECDFCGGRGFHKPGCPESDETRYPNGGTEIAIPFAPTPEVSVPRRRVQSADGERDLDVIESDRAKFWPEHGEID